MIGKRPIDLHLMALRHLGAEIEEQEAYLSAYCGKFMGKEIVFPHSSVGATQQAVLAAVCACGETHVYGCAGRDTGCEQDQGEDF